MPGYPDPPFREPLRAAFVYVGWTIDPVRIGPFVRSSRIRRERMGEICSYAAELGARSDIHSVRVFEASFILPLPRIPRHDIVMLVQTSTVESAEAVRDDSALRSLGPAATFVASNGARFGDTGNPASDVNVLLNHFTGPPDRSSATDAWRRISAWYVTKLGVDNSTLLVAEAGAPYVMVNYVRIPGAVVPFMFKQLLRPSFHRYVRALLRKNHLTALPLFVRPRAAE